MNTLIDSLRKRCQEMPGATMDTPDEYVIFDNPLAQIFVDEAPAVMLRCRDDVRARLQQSAPGVRISERMHWDTKGWNWTDVPLDGSVPEADLLPLIEDSYEICCAELRDDQRVILSVLARNLPPAELVTELLSLHGLAHRQKEIAGLADPALLLRTREAVESAIPIGQTKIGGQPDLPAGAEWPKFRNGKPLAFLAQINLADAALAHRLSELPKTGLLSIFSVYGWQAPVEYDPQLPNGNYNYTWTRVLYHPGDQNALQRRPTPSGVNAFKAAAADFVPVACFPTVPEEPDCAEIDWDGNEDNYMEFVMAYNCVLGHQLGNPARNLLQGYADYEQQFVEEVADENLQLLFQLASDAHADMCWGDGGYVYFWIRPDDLARHYFDKIYTDHQCG